MRSILLSLCLLAFAAVSASGDEFLPGLLPEGLAAQARPIGFETEGTLRRNNAAGPGQSPYALLDSAGRVIFFVEPKWGVKLAPHAGRRVKVSGLRSRVAGQNTPVLTVQSIEPFLNDPSQAEDASNAVAAAPRTRPRSRPAQTRAPEASAVNFQERLPEAMPVDPEGVYYDSETGEVVGDNHHHARAPYAMQEESCEGIAPSAMAGVAPYYGPPMCRWSGLFVRAEYLYWHSEGMDSPALVTTSPNGTARADAGVLGTEGVSVLFGNSEINNEGLSGARITFGLWFDDCRKHAIEADYWGLGTANNGFYQSSPGNPILARPFFDIVNGTESSELVSFPNVLSGSVTVDPVTHVQGFGVRKRWNLCGCCECDPCQPLCCTGWSFDVTGGYRFMRLDDSITITENLRSLDTANPGSFVVRDFFDTENTFNGAEIGTVLEGRRGRVSYEGIARLAVGSTHSIVNISGSTDITPAGGRTTRSTGGLLAQRTNIGTYERDDFAVLPELGATVGWQITPVWRVTLGYTFIYWSNVVRAGQQIDTDVNTNLLPPEADPFTGPLRPRFVFNDTDYWVQGVNVGLDARW